MPIIPTKYRRTKQYHLVFCRLLAAAQKRDEVLYPDLAAILGIPPGPPVPDDLPQVLGEISEDEHVAGRPLLSAIAVSVKSVPGEGFFTLARGSAC